MTTLIQVGKSLWLDAAEVVAVQFVPGGNPFGAKQSVEASIYLRGGARITVSEVNGFALIDHLSGKSAPSDSPIT